MRPIDYMAMQVTGTVEWMGEPTPEDLERVHLHIDRFVDETITIGMPPNVRLLAGDTFTAVRVAMRRFFEQTPGVRAGSLL